MFKNPFKFAFTAKECEDFLSDISIYLEPMSFNHQNSPLDQDDIETFFNDFNEITRTPPNSRPIPITPTDMQNIQQLEEVLINSDPISPSHTSNDSVIQRDDQLFSPRDNNLIDVNLNEAIIGSSSLPTTIPTRDSMQTTSNQSPVSPVTDVCQIIGGLTMDEYIPSLTYGSPPNVDSSSLMSSSQRIRCDSSGSTYSDGIPVMQSYYSTNINTPTCSQSVPTHPAVRGGHSVQPYGRSITAPLPPLPDFEVFRHNTVSQTTAGRIERTVRTSIPLVSPCLSSQLSQPEQFPYTQRWSSAPEVRTEYTTRANHRGRPFSRLREARRQLTLRERREQMEGELAALEATNYELNSRFGYLYSVTQYFRRRLRDFGYSQSQLDDILAQMPYNPNEGPK